MIEFVDKLPHISMAAEVLFHIGGFPITNSLVATWISMLLLIVGSLVFTRRMKLVPSGFQNVVETSLEMFYDGVAKVRAGDKANLFFPLAGTFFFFILLSNWMGLMPGFGSIGFMVEHHGEREMVPLLRAANADLNTTIALALLSVIGAQIYGIKVRGFFGYAGRFIRVGGFVAFFKGLVGRGPRQGFDTLLNAVIDAFVGSLEILDEMTKLLSYSFRLFGNIFAGEVLLIVISMLLPWLAPLPFLALEIFVGYIQALIFATLTLVFMSHAAHEEGH
ncbi:MAG: FoF1 ATP synthase subunit a [Chloroflexota bacterium]|nr:FoF1 ATP synthase subunit a [Chloroflexota bacterium]